MIFPKLIGEFKYFYCLFEDIEVAIKKDVIVASLDLRAIPKEGALTEGPSLRNSV
jgi:hypothetical protein